MQAIQNFRSVFLLGIAASQLSTRLPAQTPSPTQPETATRSAQQIQNNPAPAPNAVTKPPEPAVEPAVPAVPAVTKPPLSLPPLELVDGDCVMLLGDTLIERERIHGYLETRLISRYPDRNITFRNLGWSADTPMGRSRVSFDWSKSEEEWFKQLKTQIAAVKPTVAILGYGMASSFDGEAGLPKFKADLNKLMDAIQEVSEKQVRFVLLSPIRHENLGAPWPDPTKHNEQLSLYTQAIKEIAEQRQCRFISLFDLLPYRQRNAPPVALTENGIHLTAAGYWRLAEVVESGLGLAPLSWRLGITGDGKVRPGSGPIDVQELEKRTNYVRFKGRLNFLDNVPAPGNEIQPRILPYVQFAGMKPGVYKLKIDGQTVGTFNDRDWRSAVPLTGGASNDQAEKLREAIIRKNELFFHRWRPENQTYLFGFRKYEQGQNAREIPMFDPLIAEQEKKIAELRKPVAHLFELVAADEATATAASGGANAKVDGAKTETAPATSSSAPSAVKERPKPDFQIAEGFEIELFAEDPQLAKPIQMNFDSKGRLWIASSSVYPQIEPGQVANDKILVLEDTDGDGKADKSTVFAAGLLIPTGVEPGDGGAYVGQSTELLHFKDTDGDGKADQKRIVLSGFGTEDTHHIVHTLRWGMDGQLYFNQSIYIHTHIETPHGVVRLNSGGILHLRPPTEEVGIFLKGFVNSWGHDFDAFGQSFITDGAGGEGINYGMPGAMYVTYAGARRILGSVSPGSYPKFCSLEIVASEHFPEDWQGNVITCDFRAHRVVRFAISEEGSAYAAKQMPDLLRSSDVTFRPIDVKLGPDGALYIADWSNPIIQHGEVDFRDPRRDHEHGRIWRVTAKGRKLVSKPKLVDASNAELFGQLLSPNAFNRKQARRVLTERGGPAIALDLVKWTLGQTAEKAMLEALWTFQAVDVVEPALLEKLLAAKDGRIRAAATRVLQFWHGRLTNSESLLARLIADEHPRVRLEAMRVLSHIPTARSAELVLSALEKPMDRFLDYAIWLSINDLAEPWIAAVQSGEWKIEGRERQLEFGLNAVEPKLAAPVLSQLLKDKPIPRDGSGPWIELIGRTGGITELQKLLDEIVVNGSGNGATESTVTRALTALNDAARLRNTKPADNLEKVGALLDSSQEKTASTALHLAGVWKVSSLNSAIVQLAQDYRKPLSVRQAAIDAIQAVGGKDAVTQLRELAEPRYPTETRQAAAAALGKSDLARSMPQIESVLAATQNENDALSLWRALLSNKGAAAVFARSLPKSKLPAVVAKAGMRVAREGGRSEPELVLALAQSGNLEDEARNLTPAEIQQMAASVSKEGDAARGEKVYRRIELSCVNCHAIGGVGGKVGPDLTSIGASAPVDYLIESLLYPNRKIKEGYHSIAVETKDGQEFSGILVRETSDQLILRDATNKEISVPKNTIQKRAMGGSLMPSGLIDNLSAAEQMDLYRFLSELGKPGRYDASRGNVARLWKLYPATIDVSQFGDERVLKSSLNDRGWDPAYALVDGTLTKDALQTRLTSAAGRYPSALYAAVQFQMPKSGEVRLDLSCKDSMAVWIDGRPAGTSSPVQAELSAGIHTFVVKLDAKKLPDQLRLETSDGTFLTE